MPGDLNLRRPKPYPDRDLFVHMSFIIADNNTSKSGITAATHFTAKFRPPTVKLTWVNVG